MSAAYLMFIVDETLQEEEIDTTRKERHDKRTEETKIGWKMGQYGKRRMTYSVAVIDGFKRNARVYVEDYS